MRLKVKRNATRRVINVSYFSDIIISIYESRTVFPAYISFVLQCRSPLFSLLYVSLSVKRNLRLYAKTIEFRVGGRYLARVFIARI